MPRHITAVSCNFERNGDGDYKKWLAMHQRLAQLRPTILCRQENPGHAPRGSGNKLFNASKRILGGLEGDLGPKSATALYYDPDVFEQVMLWDTDWPNWLMPPTAMTLRVRGTDNIDLVAGSAHLSYNSPALRSIQADDVTRFADKAEIYPTPDGEVERKLPVLAIGIDFNSYVDPDRLVPGELPIPTLAEIKDPQHRAHRSYEISPGRRVMDSLPDRTLLTAHLEDAARHSALLPGGPGLAAVAPTVDASESHGPAHRVDRVVTTDFLLPAVVRVEVVDMKGLSDHHTVVVTYDLDAVVEIYRARFGLAT
ncbi:hypothetical protein GCM10009540_85280 [Streptomyces turgidiscabies]